MVKSWRYQNNGEGYEIQQFRKDENFCRIQTGKHGGVHIWQHEAEEEEEVEREMKKGGKDYNFVNAIWVNIENYEKFCMEWVMICATLNRGVDNPNRILARQWNIRGRLR